MNANSEPKISENDTFNRLARLSFEEIMQAMTGAPPDDGFYKLTMADIASFDHVTPTEEFWAEYGIGWTWEEFRKECKLRRKK